VESAGTVFFALAVSLEDECLVLLDADFPFVAADDDFFAELDEDFVVAFADDFLVDVLDDVVCLALDFVLFWLDVVRDLALCDSAGETATKRHAAPTPSAVRAVRRKRRRIRTN
jgi:hypothetical protein